MAHAMTRVIHKWMLKGRPTGMLWLLDMLSGTPASDPGMGPRSVRSAMRRCLHGSYGGRRWVRAVRREAYGAGTAGRSELDRGFDGQAACGMGVCIVGVVPSYGPCAPSTRCRTG
jgi:hypothetical protein